MKDTVIRYLLERPGVVLTLVFVVLLLVGGVGEVAAHNPAGQPVPGCENGADAAAHSNPNCHG